MGQMQVKTDEDSKERPVKSREHNLKVIKRVEWFLRKTVYWPAVTIPTRDLMWAHENHDKIMCQTSKRNSLLNLEMVSQRQIKGSTLTSN